MQYVTTGDKVICFYRCLNGRRHLLQGLDFLDSDTTQIPLPICGGHIQISLSPKMVEMPFPETSNQCTIPEMDWQAFLLLGDVLKLAGKPSTIKRWA